MNLSIDEMKSVQLEILEQISLFCKSKGLKFFLSYGSLLGAVRHQGYIPWDDDIDVAFLRDDYVRFVKAMRKDKAFCEKYELWGPDQPHKYYNLQPTLMRRGTVFVNENAYAGSTDQAS